MLKESCGQCIQEVLVTSASGSAISGVAAVLSDICWRLFQVRDMNDEIGEWAGKLRLNIVATEDECSHFEGRIVGHCSGSICFGRTGDLAMIRNVKMATILTNYRLISFLSQRKRFTIFDHVESLFKHLRFIDFSVRSTHNNQIIPFYALPRYFMQARYFMHSYIHRCKGSIRARIVPSNSSGPMRPRTWGRYPCDSGNDNVTTRNPAMQFVRKWIMQESLHRCLNKTDGYSPCWTLFLSVDPDLAKIFTITISIVSVIPIITDINYLITAVHKIANVHQIAEQRVNISKCWRLHIFSLLWSFKELVWNDWIVRGHEGKKEKQFFKEKPAHEGHS
jgi:hypothetical protein